MDQFVPRGLLPLQHAVERVCETLFGDEWRNALPTASEEEAVRRFNDARKERERTSQILKVIKASKGNLPVTVSPRPQPDPQGLERRLAKMQELEQRAAEAPEIRSLNAKLNRRETMQHRAVAQIRSALYAGDVSAMILTVHGFDFEVPRRIWASSDAPTVFRSGCAKFSTGYGYNLFTVEGRVLLQKAALDAWLTPSGSSSIQADVAAESEKAPEPSPDPDPYRTGLPGRPPKIKHLIEQEFRRRAEAGQVISPLAAEARVLREWARHKHPSAPPPTEKTIQNSLRDLYREYVRNSAQK
jgi:hypothetical protein